MTRAVLFDLDGTLLPLDFERFFRRYIERVCRFYRGAVGVELGPALERSAAAMMSNPGARSNAEVFWQALTGECHQPQSVLENLYVAFIEQEGADLGAGVVPDPAAAQIVAAWKARGAKVVLATNPVFPRLLIDLRARWAALDPATFDLVTCYETMRACKPRPAYYRQIAERLGVEPSECLMVGNDVGMDLRPAAELGMRTCLVTGSHTVAGGEAFEPTYVCPLSQVGALP